VAANGQACILAFEYDILCQKATEDVELREALAEAIQRMTNRPGEVVCLTVEQWATLRRNYVQDLKAGKIQPKQTESEAEKNPAPNKPVTQEFSDYDVPPPPFDDFAMGSDEDVREEEKQQEVVEQAISIFGEENVTIIND
jgi:DNA polymerase-3 subunit gamma/tau